MADRPSAFVTGGTGFIGSHLVEELLRRGYGPVRCLVRKELRWLEGLDVEPVRCTLFDADRLTEAVADVDYVFHVGAVTRSLDDDVFQRENVEATLRLLDAVADAAPAIRRVVVTSSLAVIGRSGEVVADERSPMRPISGYGRSKAAMERSLAAGRGSMAPWIDQLPIVVIRPPSVYGPREADIYTMFKTARLGLFPMMGSGRDPEVSLVHVADVVRGMVDAAESPDTVGKTYFVGSARPYAWREVHRAMRDALDRPVLALPVPSALVGPVGVVSEAIGRVQGIYPPLNREKAREVRWACKACSIERAAADFGYQQRIPLEDGIRSTAAWYRENGWL